MTEEQSRSRAAPAAIDNNARGLPPPVTDQQRATSSSASSGSSQRLSTDTDTARGLQPPVTKKQTHNPTALTSTKNQPATSPVMTLLDQLPTIRISYTAQAIADNIVNRLRLTEGQQFDLLLNFLSQLGQIEEEYRPAKIEIDKVDGNWIHKYRMKNPSDPDWKQFIQQGREAMQKIREKHRGITSRWDSLYSRAQEVLGEYIKRCLETYFAEYAFNVLFGKEKPGKSLSEYLKTGNQALLSFLLEDGIKKCTKTLTKEATKALALLGRDVLINIPSALIAELVAEVVFNELLPPSPVIDPEERFSQSSIHKEPQQGQ